MNTPESLREQVVARCRDTEPDVDPAVVGRIVDEVLDSLDREGGVESTASPFAVPWMDAYLGHWFLGQRVRPEADRLDEVAPALRDLMDTRLTERLDEIRGWIERFASPPDGGTPEPGVPPVGPSVPVPPDGGPPEPGVPPVGPAVFEPPDGGPPEPGVPPVGPAVFEPPDGGPPEPGVPPVGPSAALPEENPWILYWFVSLKLPTVMDVLDAHLERRLSELGFEGR